MDREILLKWEQQLLEKQQHTEHLLKHVRALLEEIPTEDGQLSAPRTRRSNARNQAAADATYKELTERGEPTERGVLFDVLVEQGFRFGGQTPINTYGAILSRDARFQPAGRRGFWELVEWEQERTTSVEASRPFLLNNAAVTER